MDRVKKVVFVLAVVAAVMAVDRLWIHLIHWSVIGGWIESFGRLFKG